MVTAACVCQSSSVTLSLPVTSAAQVLNAKYSFVAVEYHIGIDFALVGLRLG
jgi:hypothetical protein